MKWDPFSSEVDALAQQDWASHNNYVNAPFHLIPQVLKILMEQQAEATLIAPYWSAQPWTATYTSVLVGGQPCQATQFATPACQFSRLPRVPEKSGLEHLCLVVIWEHKLILKAGHPRAAYIKLHFIGSVLPAGLEHIVIHVQYVVHK